MIAAGLTGLLISGCQSVELEQTAGGQPIERFTLENPQGVRAVVLSYGALLAELHVPDRHGQVVDVVLGHDDLAGYEADRNYLGRTVGRLAHRVTFGRLRIGDRTYRLAPNEGAHHHNGGAGGLHRAVWHGERLRNGRNAVRFTHRSPAGEEGYPGNLDVAVTYELTALGELRIEFEAVTDAPTPVGLAHHSYFNLAGPGTDILQHELQVTADRYLPVDPLGLPTGRIESVLDTPLDFRRPQPIGWRIGEVGPGYNHAYLLNRGEQQGLFPAAVLRHRPSGRVMEVHTTMPVIQVDTANRLGGTQGKHGVVYPVHGGVRLQPERYPDAVNQPTFPAVILQPGEAYREVVVYRFRTLP